MRTIREPAKEGESSSKS
jgi:hypothetical protein